MCDQKECWVARLSLEVAVGLKKPWRRFISRPNFGFIMTDVNHPKVVHLPAASPRKVHETMCIDVIFPTQVESASNSIHIKSYGHSSNDWTFVVKKGKPI
jgi:hypothetical protein